MNGDPTPQEPSGPLLDLLSSFWPLAELCRLTTELLALTGRVDRMEQEMAPLRRLPSLEARMERLETELTTARQMLALAREQGFTA